MFNLFGKNNPVQSHSLAKSLKLDTGEYPTCDYDLPPLCSNSAISFKADFFGIGPRCTYFDLLPNSYLAATLISDINDTNNSAAIQVWDLSTGKCVKNITADDGDVKFILGLTENRFVTIEEADSDHSDDDATSIIKIWEINSENALQKIEINKTITAVTKVSDTCIATATSSTVQLWDLKSGQCTKTLANCGGKIGKLLVISESGLLITGDVSRDKKALNSIKIWSITTGELRKEFNDEHIKDLALVTSKQLASLSDNIRVWNIETAECIKTFPVMKDSFLMTLSENHLVSAGHDNSLRIWRLNDGKCLQNLGGTSIIWASMMEFAIPKKLPDGNLVSYYASSNFDRSIRIWKFPELKFENNETIDNKSTNTDSSRCQLQ